MSIEDIIRKAENKGWKIERTKKNHLKFLSPNGIDIVLVGAIPGRKLQSRDKLIASLKRHGLDVTL